MLNDQVKTQLLTSQYLPVLLSVTLENLIVLVIILKIDKKKKKKNQSIRTTQLTKIRY